MRIAEFRISLPMTTEEYDLAQRYTVAEISKEETGGGEGVQVLIDEKFSGLIDGVYREGQFTKKKYFLASKLPSFISSLVGAENLVVEEESWNAFPFGRTIFKNPHYMKEHFFIQVDSMHLEDDGSSENALNLTPTQLELREVVLLDIGKDKAHSKIFERFDDDPSTYKSEKAGRGPLLPGWQKETTPIMTCYKVVYTHFCWFGIQNFVENKLVSSQKEYMLVFHRKVFCLMDQWYGMSWEDLVKYEAETRQKLDDLRTTRSLQGVGAVEKILDMPSSKVEVESAKHVTVEKVISHDPKEEKVEEASSMSEESSSMFEEEFYIDSNDCRRGKVTIRGFNFSYTISYPA